MHEILEVPTLGSWKVPSCSRTSPIGARWKSGRIADCHWEGLGSNPDPALCGLRFSLFYTRGAPCMLSLLLRSPTGALLKVRLRFASIFRRPYSTVSKLKGVTEDSREPGWTTLTFLP